MSAESSNNEWGSSGWLKAKFMGLDRQERKSVPEKKIGARRGPHMLVGEPEVQAAKDAGKYIIFLGGACNRINSDGLTERTDGRDGIIDMIEEINKDLVKKGEDPIYYFDPQIDEKTHGSEYDSIRDGNAEKLAIATSTNDLIQFRPDTPGPVSALEIARDIKNGGGNITSKRVIYIEGYDPEEPELSLNFNPEGFFSGTPSEAARRAHYTAYAKSANQMRAEFLQMLQDDGNILSEQNKTGNVRILQDEGVVGASDAFVKQAAIMRSGEFKGRVFVITDEKAHYADLLKAFHLASQGKPVMVYFRGSKKDKDGNPMVNFSAFPTTTTKSGKVIEDRTKSPGRVAAYMEEVNEMRRELMDLVKDDEHTHVVSNPKEVVEQLMKNREQQLERQPEPELA